ncbi:MAG TPA: radical SAM protein, partial [bacterium]|nr:radical SAM protein [bacterium]
MSERLKEAAYYDVDQDAARCRLCPQACGIMPGRTGICGTRRFRDGRLELLNYGRYTSIAVDPIEKKPLYHFHPGKEILSIGGKGCNLKCAFCQNCEISQGDPVTHAIEPEELAGLSAKYSERSVGVAFTYNEPLIWFEFIRAAAPLIRADGGKVVLVTNGFINPAPLAELLPLVDAMNIDLKSFDDVFYKKYCGGRIDPVKETIAAAAAAGSHIEVTVLLIPEFNDSRDMLHDQA